MTYVLGIELEFQSEDLDDLAATLRDIADWLDEEGVASCPIAKDGERIGRVTVEETYE